MWKISKSSDRVVLLKKNVNMPFVICCITHEGSNTLVKDWYDCSILNDQLVLTKVFNEFILGTFVVEKHGDLLL